METPDQLKLTITTPKWCQLRRFGVFIINFEDILPIVLVFPLLTLIKCPLGSYKRWSWTAAKTYWKYPEQY